MLQQIWSTTASRLDPFQIFSLSYVVFVATYWGIGLAFLAIDLLRPGWAAPFKCQPAKHVITADVKKCVINILKNQVTTYPLFFLLLWPVAKRRLSFSEQLPPFTELLWTVPAFALITEVTFYYGHRAFHIPALYKRFHKQHHEIRAPFAICAIYFHPVEHVQTVVDAVAPALLLKSHVSVCLLWIFLATANVLLHHCGYDFEPYWPDSLRPFFSSMTQQHDYHHYAFNKCYGVLGILDWIHGTDAGLEAHLDQWKKQARGRKADS